MKKVCSACGMEKESRFFTVSAYSEDGLVSACKPCRNQQSKKWVLANKKKRSEITERYRQNNKDVVGRYYVKNKMKVKAAARRWAAANKDKIRKISKEYSIKTSHIKAARERKRTAAKLMATPIWANEFFILEAYELAKRRSVATGIKWEVDHIVPLLSDKVCGLHVESNLQVIPKRLNTSKGNRYWPDMPTENNYVR